jgi:hypothetical protein
MTLQPRKGAFLFGLHQPAVARDVRGDYGGQPAFYALRVQGGAP